MASTELFKVTCVTCQASLSVRNTALIGQIVGCPRCNSMVEITRPASQVSSAPAAVTPAAAPVVVQSVFEEPADIPSEEHAAEQLTQEDVASVLSTSATSSTKFIMWAVASFVVGATLTTAVLVLRPKASPVAQNVTEANEIKPTPVEVLKPSEPQKADPALITPAPAETPTIDEPQVAKPAEEEPNPFLVEEKKTSEEPLLGAVEVPQVEQNDTAETEAVAPTPKEPEKKLVVGEVDEPRVAAKFDPLALNPEELDLDSITEADEKDPAHVAAADSPEKEDKQAPKPIKPSSAVLLNHNLGAESSSHSAAVQLEQQIAAVALKDIPFLDFLTAMSQFAGVPISITPEQLQMAGISPGRPVSLEVSETTLGEALASALTPLHLEVVAEGSQIVILREEADKIRGIDYPIDDLLGNETDPKQFVTWIEQLVAPESWNRNGGEGNISILENTIKVEQTQAVHYQLLFFLERIRLAKDYPLRSRYPERLLSAKPYDVGIADRLNTPTTFTFSHDTPLAEVVHYLQQEADLAIFVDWPALATQKVWPDSYITCRIANKPWREALTTILEPLGLGWRPAPGGAIQVTSLARINTEPQLEIFAASYWRANANSPDATAIHDPVNQLVYVRAPASELYRGK